MTFSEISSENVNRALPRAHDSKPSDTTNTTDIALDIKMDRHQFFERELRMARRRFKAEMPDNMRRNGSKLKMAVKNNIQRLNLARLINELEQDQNYADHLEECNKELKEEQARQEMKREAEALCLETINQHLIQFIHEHPTSSYEDWIEELHPENVHNNEIDHRFYVENSDHRKLWNDYLLGVRNYVASKALRQGLHGIEVIAKGFHVHDDAESIS
eukprot:CAMPEP_0202461040 /NCGR_PEP_ID=MMETSP1360-20130828/47432_1 /ASSEMBLY_ACC=CAM_ASM_000848 /TAXON_ID=515479 /ORGANISM="Licmophora paradoxa, Strain CCMP2313" /LENGTH=216 /DNA_ID=CAMNT_0049082935 /DNA_START=82 /DNA_END=732 /DNA_ORIENTATION=-